MLLDLLVGCPLTDLPTPSLVVDLDRIEANLARLASHGQALGVGLRPHAKTHKCPEIARRQVALGALGISVATVDEAEAMVAAGLPGVLLTSPIVDRGKIGRMVALKRSDGDVLLAVGHALEADLLDEAAGASGVTIEVLLDLDVGDHRIGVAPGTPARELAERIGRCRRLRLIGVQAYSGLASHVVGFDSRRQYSHQALAPAAELRDALVRSGHDARILSVGSTGTYNIDAQVPGVTELQCGSYVFMDQDYRRIGSSGDVADYGDFAPSLSVLATVVHEHAEGVTLDAGIKAFATDVAIAPEIIGRPDLRYQRRGDEFGQVSPVASGVKLPSVGDRLRLGIPHCDPTVNLYDRLYVVRNERIEAVWPILARREFPPLAP